MGTKRRAVWTAGICPDSYRGRKPEPFACNHWN